jgi:ssDNA-binding Zn-finger/Zn-ribbon topoisomerase 1
MQNEPEKIFIHCSDSDFGNMSLIRKWHSDPPPKGRGWRTIGYHFVIPNGYPTCHHMRNAIRWEFLDGTVEVGRPLDSDPYIDKSEAGAHVYGFNSKSIGICLIGTKFFTKNQLISLKKVCIDLCIHFKLDIKDVLGHYEFDSNKTCPNINMLVFRKFLGVHVNNDNSIQPTDFYL